MTTSFLSRPIAVIFFVFHSPGAISRAKMWNLLIRYILWAPPRFVWFTLFMLIFGDDRYRTRYIDGRDLLAFLQQPTDVVGTGKLSNYTRHNVSTGLHGRDNIMSHPFFIRLKTKKKKTPGCAVSFFAFVFRTLSQAQTAGWTPRRVTCESCERGAIAEKTFKKKKKTIANSLG